MCCTMRTLESLMIEYVSDAYRAEDNAIDVLSFLAWAELCVPSDEADQHALLVGLEHAAYLACPTCRYCHGEGFVMIRGVEEECEVCIEEDGNRGLRVVWSVEPEPELIAAFEAEFTEGGVAQAA